MIYWQNAKIYKCNTKTTKNTKILLKNLCKWKKIFIKNGLILKINRYQKIHYMMKTCKFKEYSCCSKNLFSNCLRFLKILSILLKNSNNKTFNTKQKRRKRKKKKRKRKKINNQSNNKIPYKMIIKIHHIHLQRKKSHQTNYKFKEKLTNRKFKNQLKKI